MDFKSTTREARKPLAEVSAPVQEADFLAGFLGVVESLENCFRVL